MGGCSVWVALTHVCYEQGKKYVLNFPFRYLTHIPKEMRQMSMSQSLANPKVPSYYQSRMKA